MQRFNYYVTSDIFCLNASVTTESQTSLSISGFICMINFFYTCHVTWSWPPTPATICHIFLEPSPRAWRTLWTVPIRA